MNDLEMLARHAHEAPDYAEYACIPQTGVPKWANGLDSFNLADRIYTISQIHAMRDELIGNGDWEQTLEEREEMDKQLQKGLDRIAKTKEQPQWWGEGLPPVGTVCEVRFRYPGSDYTEWFECKFKAGFDSKLWFSAKGVAVENHWKELTLPSHDVDFRPIRTEREKCIDVIAKEIEEVHNWTAQVMAQSLYDHPRLKISLEEE